MRAGDSRRDLVVIRREDLQRAPGTYLITVVSGAQVISDFGLAVQRATAGGDSPKLAGEDRGVLEEVRSHRLLERRHDVPLCNRKQGPCLPLDLALS